MSTADASHDPADVEGDEPNALGAAATLPAERRRRRRAAEREARRTSAAGRRERAQPVALEGGSGVVNVYEPRSGSSTSLRQYAAELWERRQFLTALAKSDLRGSRSSTVLGGIWGLLDPLFQSMIYYMLFAIIRGGQGRPIEFLPLLIGGIFLFRLATSALSDGGKSINKASSLMLNSNFPRAILPLSTIYKGVIEFIPTIVVFAGVYLLLGPPLQLTLLWVPVLFVIQLLLSVGLALVTSTMVVFFKDTEKALNYVTRIFFFTTPVIWPLDLLPEKMQSVLVFQPLFSLFANYQRVFGGGNVAAADMFYALGWTTVFLVGGIWLFRRYEHDMGSRL